MPRLARVDVGGEVYHVLNRSNGRVRIFYTPKQYQAFEKHLLDAKELVGMRILAYCIMPNHWHLVLYPEHDGDLKVFMHQITNTHTRQVRVATKTIGNGHLYQGRYKSFLVDSDTYLLTLIKYVERNPVRAKLTESAEEWQWGSAWRRVHGTPQHKKLLAPSPLPLPHRYTSWLNTNDNEDDLSTIRKSVNKGVPYGKEEWVDSTVAKYGLESTQREPGRPRKAIL